MTCTTDPNDSQTIVFLPDAGAVRSSRGITLQKAAMSELGLRPNGAADQVLTLCPGGQYEAQGIRRVVSGRSEDCLRGQRLNTDAEVTVWLQGVFHLSSYPIESLIEALTGSDFGVFVFSPDDVVLMRKKEQQAVRDNVIFELGLFVGRLGRERNFIVMAPGDGQNLQHPID